MRFPRAEVVRPDPVRVRAKEELHRVHVPFGEVDYVNVVPKHVGGVDQKCSLLFTVLILLDQLYVFS